MMSFQRPRKSSGCNQGLCGRSKKTGAGRLLGGGYPHRRPSLDEARYRSCGKAFAKLLLDSTDRKETSYIFSILFHVFETLYDAVEAAKRDLRSFLIRGDLSRDWPNPHDNRGMRREQVDMTK